MILSLIGPPEARASYEALGYPCFEDHSLAVRAMAALRYFGEVFEKEETASPTIIGEKPVLTKRQRISEFDAKKIFSTAGMPITLETLAQTSDEAIGFWKKIKKPVVLKVSSLDLQHKTDTVSYTHLTLPTKRIV